METQQTPEHGNGQNGFDNGGICGVCKWSKNPEEVEFVLTVLERLAKRYRFHIIFDSRA